MKRLVSRGAAERLVRAVTVRVSWGRLLVGCYHVAWMPLTLVLMLMTDFRYLVERETRRSWVVRLPRGVTEEVTN